MAGGIFLPDDPNNKLEEADKAQWTTTWETVVKINSRNPKKHGMYLNAF